MIIYNTLINSPLRIFEYNWYVEVSDVTQMFNKIPDDTIRVFSNIKNITIALGTRPSNTYDIDKVNNIESIKVKTLKELHK